MRILGIESSCDETAAAVVEDGERVLSSVVASQLDTHGKYGGVVPELASREHLRAIVPAVRLALEQAELDLGSISGDRGHGRAGAGGLAAGGHHLREVAVLSSRNSADRRESYRGPHSRRSQAARGGVSGSGAGGERRAYALVRGRGEFRYRLLGKTRDDAAGEAFDKVAKLLGIRLSGRAGDRSAGAAWKSARGAVHAGEDERQHARLQFQRPQDGGAALDASADMAEEITARRELLRKPAANRGAVARGDSEGDAGFAGVVSSDGDRGTAAARGAIGGRDRGAVSDRFGGVACNSGLRTRRRPRSLGIPSGSLP